MNVSDLHGVFFFAEWEAIRAVSIALLTMMHNAFYWQVPVAVAVGLVSMAQSAQELEYHDSWSAQDREAIAGIYHRCEEARDRLLVKADQGALNELESFIINLNGGLSEKEQGLFQKTVDRMARRMAVRVIMNPLLELVKHTAKTGDASYANRDRFSMLHLALAMGYHDLAKSLVGRGADVNLQVSMQPRFGGDLGGKGDTPLTRSITFSPMFENILADDLDSQKRFNVAERVDMVKFLLAHGADANARLTNDLCPLELSFLWASIQPEYTEIVGLLLAGGAKIDVREEGYEFSALCSAVSFGNLPMVERLVGMGAEVNRSVRCRGGYLKAPPLLALNWRKKASPAILRLFLTHGADPNVKSIELPEDEEDWQDNPKPASERTILMKLCQDLSSSCIQEDEEGVERVLELAKILLGKGASVSIVNPRTGRTAMEECFGRMVVRDDRERNAYVRMVRLLLDHGASTDFLWKDGKPNPSAFATLKKLPPEVLEALPEFAVLKDTVNP